MTIGENIKRKRDELNITQQELAKKCGYKSKSSINKIEHDVRNLPSKKIKLIADVLNTTPAYLMNYKQDISLNTEEQELIENYRKLNDDRKYKVKTYINEQVLIQGDIK